MPVSKGEKERNGLGRGKAVPLNPLEVTSVGWKGAYNNDGVKQWLHASVCTSVIRMGSW